YAVRDEIVALGFDGMLRRWRDGTVTAVGCGASKPLAALAISGKGTWLVVGEAGFIARSPDGQWFSKVASGVDADLEAIQMLPDGRLLAVGDHGTILISADEGRSWHPLPHELGTPHLRLLRRFGRGLLIGGDLGMVIRLAPPGDATWSERVNLFAAARTLD